MECQIFTFEKKLPLRKAEVSKLRFSEIRLHVSFRGALTHADITDITSCCNSKIRSLREKHEWLFYYFSLEMIYDV